MKILFVSPVSVTIELDNEDIYYSSKVYDVFVNDTVYLKGMNTNVFSLYDLEPDTVYKITALDKTIFVKTDPCNRIIRDFTICKDASIDVTKQIQYLIDSAKPGDMVVIEEGRYLITSLMLKSDITLYLKSGAKLIASINENDYEEFDGEIPTNDGDVSQLGTWEGSPCKMKKSIINGIEVHNVKIVGEGMINGRADESTWWINHREKPYARPHIVFLVRCRDVVLQGIKLKNSPQWTVHPYFSSRIGFYNITIENPKISPNTDGINPQCCNNVNIIGVHFSVGDDCIALKSGKIYIGKKYRTPSQNITIRNCLMQYGHGAVVLGSEMSGGIKNITVERCVFDSTDRGLRIKTRRGRGDTCIVDGVTFSNIIMKNVLTPLVINMFYFCDPDGKTEYVWSKEKLPVDDRTPYMGKFTFKNITAVDSEYAAGYFYGLPEMPIGEINIENVDISFKKDAGKGTPAMMSYAEECSRRGFVFKNVKSVHMRNVNVENQIGPVYDSEGCDEIVYE